IVEDQPAKGEEGAMPGYAEIASHFRRQIADGELAPGNKMLSYADTAKKFGVNRTTVIRAYDILKSEGLIVSVPGKGTIVAERPNVVISGVDRRSEERRVGKGCRCR